MLKIEEEFMEFWPYLLKLVHYIKRAKAELGELKYLLEVMSTISEMSKGMDRTGYNIPRKDELKSFMAKIKEMRSENPLTDYPDQPVPEPVIRPADHPWRRGPYIESSSTSETDEDWEPLTWTAKGAAQRKVERKREKIMRCLRSNGRGRSFERSVSMPFPRQFDFPCSDRRSMEGSLRSETVESLPGSQRGSRKIEGIYDREEGHIKRTKTESMQSAHLFPSTDSQVMASTHVKREPQDPTTDQRGGQEESGCPVMNSTRSIPSPWLPSSPPQSPWSPSSQPWNNSPGLLGPLPSHANNHPPNMIYPFPTNGGMDDMGFTQPPNGRVGRGGYLIPPYGGMGRGWYSRSQNGGIGCVGVPNAAQQPNGFNGSHAIKLEHIPPPPPPNCNFGVTGTQQNGGASRKRTHATTRVKREYL